MAVSCCCWLDDEFGAGTVAKDTGEICIRCLGGDCELVGDVGLSCEGKGAVSAWQCIDVLSSLRHADCGRSVTRCASNDSRTCSIGCLGRYCEWETEGQAAGATVEDSGKKQGVGSGRVGVEVWRSKEAQHKTRRDCGVVTGVSLTPSRLTSTVFLCCIYLPFSLSAISHSMACHVA